MIDWTDMEIIRCLQKNSRMQWKEIGQRVHLTGQAVAARIRRLEELGIIEEYTVKLNTEKMGRAITAFITVYMKTAGHHSFESFAAGNEEIISVHRTSGEGCYLLEASLASSEDLSRLLDRILAYGNYRVNLSIGRIKG
ncbi:MAG: transcriptional regulator [Peptococcaceae bacterium BICA1-7]|nr:MAG: transcriptional regulator [Peptococcaceae bacterium BICA1-7]HBV96246.1 Lrp/AsnC family transcriptional regulator [Desulfotomaculum sp.]